MRKRRTRSHILADLSANHVERYALFCGYSVERIQQDYGLDMVLKTYDANGEIENGHVYLQLKASERLTTIQDGRTIPFRVRRADLHYWVQEPMPVILVVYDASVEKAYWVYVQAYLEALPGFAISSVGDTMTLYLDPVNILDAEAIRQFARFRDHSLRQIRGVIRHDE